MMRALDVAALEGMVKHLQAEVARLKAGKYTPEELQHLCHNLSEEDERAFGKGGEEFQKKLFGRTYAALCDEEYRRWVNSPLEGQT